MSDAAETIEQAQETPAPAPAPSEQSTPHQPETLPEHGEEAVTEDTRPKRPSGAQRLKRRNQALQSENAELLRRLEHVDARSPDDAAPRQQDFNGDALAYERARTAWETRQAVREEFRQRDEVERAGRDLDARREQAAIYEERLEDARERIPDFDATLRAMKGTFVRDDVVEEIMASDKGPLLAYHLARNPERLRELNGLTGRELAREIGRLEGSVRMPAGNKQTKAPAPATSLKGGAAPAPSLAGKSPEEYRKLRDAGVT